MPSKKLNLILCLPDAYGRLPKDHKIPVLFWVDQPDVDIKVQHPHITGTSRFSGPYAEFTHLIWLEGLKMKEDCDLVIKAHKAGFDDCDGSHKLPRDPLESKRGDRLRAERGIPTKINYPAPSGTVPPNFAASGTVDPTEVPCTAWLVDANNNTYPGMPIPGQPNGSWAFGFQNIPPGAYRLFVRDKDGDTPNEPITVKAGP